MADKKPFVNYSGELKEIATSDTIAVANGGVDQTAWQSWTPTLTNITLGNGTLACKYKEIGKTCHYRFVLIAGSTTTIAAGVKATATFPVTAHSDNPVYLPFNMTFFDSSAPSIYEGKGLLETTTTFSLWMDFANGTYDYLGVVQSGVPVTIATNDKIILNGTYETA